MHTHTLTHTHIQTQTDRQTTIVPTHIYPTRPKTNLLFAGRIDFSNYSLPAAPSHCRDLRSKLSRAANRTSKNVTVKRSKIICEFQRIYAIQIDSPVQHGLLQKVCRHIIRLSRKINRNDGLNSERRIGRGVTKNQMQNCFRYRLSGVKK